MQAEASSSTYVQARLTALVWLCLDADLHRSAVFYAERYYALFQHIHDARHLYATALLRSGQPHSAYHLVNLPIETPCAGCSELKAKCCTALGRHRQAREALGRCINDPLYIPTISMGTRFAAAFPETAVLLCRSGTAGMKGNMSDAACKSFRDALDSDPMLWEAFEGMCTLGYFPPLDTVFPLRPPPVKPPPQCRPAATGTGFFTPEAANNAASYPSWGNGLNQSQAFRMDATGPRDSLSTIESSFAGDDSFAFKPIKPILASRSQPGPSSMVQPPAVRPLSSADEMGPVAKKLRSTARQRAPPTSIAADTNFQSSKSAGALLQGVADDRSKSSKARARPALTIANIFSSPGRRAQQAATSSRSTAAPSKAAKEQPAPLNLTRRSSRLLGGTSSKAKHATKPITKDRRRAAMRTRTQADSDMDDDPPPSSAIPPPSPLSYPPLPDAIHLPGFPTLSSDIPPTTIPSLSSGISPEELYEMQMADYIVYNLMRTFASATRALAMHDCRACLLELEKLPREHQRSAWVMAMVGKAHYELGEYAAAERAFEAVRNLEPYRLWDMEVYSTLLWHLQRNVKLAFLAQELLAIDPRSPEAWIAIGNTFSLQKERTQALTCFNRAAQLDPTCAYAFTLSGHESVEEDLEKAITFFQSALRADHRHYNAWYGLGVCYMRMSKLRLAEYHYGKAAEIHNQNAVLLGCLGMVHERRGNWAAALKMFNQAVSLSQDNALVRYHRAKILISMKKYQLAIQDLEALRDSSPDESNVVFQLAKVYRLIGDKAKSAQTLAAARDLSPKSISKIQKLLETVKDEEVMDEG
ncbi:protein prenylyltransferase [Cytidiella melzeri]|nr:protein prenylyltransferase [Cytidiella melzeri]